MPNAVVVETTHSPHARLRPVPVSAVTLTDAFWAPRREANQARAIPHLLALLEAHGVLDNFRRVYGAHAGPRRGYLFTDSDLYKWLEAAAWCVAANPEAPLRPALEQVLDTVLPAQGADGYLNTWFVDERASQRFTDLDNAHELYCAGHFIQAALAHTRGAGAARLLNAARRFADYIDVVFRQAGRPDSDGHPEVEMALVELYRTTREPRYLALAGHFLERRGIADRHTIHGHAVRAAYAMAGATDYYLETGDPRYRAASEAQWRDMTTRKAYLTGGVGGRPEGESFGQAYELPNERAYAETCAAIASIMWTWRLLHLDGAALYTDWLERTLYNGFLAGVSLAGTEYFYVNPLAASGQPEADPWYRWAQRPPYQRREWYDCTCCPPNVQRLLASLPGYFYSTSADGVWVHLFAQSQLDWPLADGTPLRVEQQTRYPWDGVVTLRVAPAAAREFTLYLRVPGWAEAASVVVDGAIVPAVTPGRYLALRRVWRPDSQVTLTLPMPARRLVSDPRLASNRGNVAVQRGPLVYCLEGHDHGYADVRALVLPDDAALTPRDDGARLGGITVLDAVGRQLAAEAAPLYRPLGAPAAVDDGVIPLQFIPYYAWANRGPASMTVWVARTP